MRAVPQWSLVLILAAIPVQALSQYLVKDINPAASPASSSPQDFVPVGNVVTFTATDPFTGPALWRSDGTAKGTYPLSPGCTDCVGQGFALTPSSYFFYIFDFSGNGTATLWVTSGTPDTTLPLVRGLRLDYGAQWVPEQGLLYFGADDGVHGDELWRTDGTVAGTFMVTDLAPGAVGSSPTSLTDFGGELFFSANDGSGFALWKTDGTARGTHLVKRPAPGLRSAYEVSAIAAVGRWLVFGAYSPSRGYELWRTDGTSSGTVPLRDLVPGAGSPTFYGFYPLGQRLLFAADTGHGANLWVTDGTNPGTRQLTHYTSRQPFDPYFGLYGASSAGRLFFPVDDGVHGRELWTSDGTPAGTHLVSDVCPGPCSSNPYPGIFAAGRLLFAADDGVHGFELWSTDGTAGATWLVKDVCPGPCSSSAYPVAILGGKAVLLANDGQTGPQLWRTDGTAGSAARLTAFTDPSLFQNGVDGAVAGGRLLLFAGEDSAHGKELWRTDGTRAGTYLLKDIATQDLGGSAPSDMHAAGARLFFLANDGVHGYGLWSSDGTAAGTALASTFGLAPGSEIGPPSGLQSTAAVAETLFFTVSVQENSPALWKSDGTPAGTQLLTASGVSARGEVAAVGGTVFFIADDGVHGPALWKSDGTPAGTVPVDPVAWTGGGAQRLTPFQGQLFFFLEGGDAYWHLWRSDGTPSGTVQVANLNAPASDDDPTLLIELGGRLYFFAEGAPGPGGSQRLWSTDGTTAGTQQVSALGLPAQVPFSQEQLAVAGDRLFILGATISASGGWESELWVSDGTDAGTHLVQSFGVVLAQPETVDFGGRLAFTGPGSDSGSPVSLWLSDGTAAGTAPLLDASGHRIQPVAQTLRSFAGYLVYEAGFNGAVVLWQSDGAPSGTATLLTVSPPSYYFGNDLVIAGDLLFLNAYDPATGDELWAVRP